MFLFFAMQIGAQVRKPNPKSTPTLKPTPSITSIEATTNDGTKVILRSDKSWEYSKAAQDKPTEERPSSKLDVPLIGDDPQEFIAFYKEGRFTLAKSQYETEKQFIDRLRQVTFESKGAKKPASDIVFVIDGKHRYNAENESFFYSVESYPDIAFSPIRFVKDFRSGGPGEYMLNKPEFSFKVPLASARTVGSKLKVAVFGYPVALEERIAGYPMLSFFMKRIVVFDSETGDVYYEQKF
jgi:hypothetical protein